MAYVKKANRKVSKTIDDVRWEVLSAPHTKTVLDPDSMTVCFSFNKKKEKVDEIRIRFGQHVLLKTGWQHKDRIEVFCDPDDIFSLKLAKTNSKCGYIIQRENNRDDSAFNIVVKWNQVILLDPMQTTRINFEIIRKMVFLRLPVE